MGGGKFLLEASGFTPTRRYGASGGPTRRKYSKARAVVQQAPKNHAVPLGCAFVPFLTPFCFSSILEISTNPCQNAFLCADSDSWRPRRRGETSTIDRPLGGISEQLGTSRLIFLAGSTYPALSLPSSLTIPRYPARLATIPGGRRDEAGRSAWGGWGPWPTVPRLARPASLARG